MASGRWALVRNWHPNPSHDFCHRAFLWEADTLLESQAGPHAARVLTARRAHPEFTLSSPPLQAILLCRLRLALPLTPDAGVVHCATIEELHCCADLPLGWCSGCPQFLCRTSTSTPSAKMTGAQHGRQPNSKRAKIRWCTSTTCMSVTEGVGTTPCRLQFACAARASSNSTALTCPNRARLAPSAMCRCSGRST